MISTSAARMPLLIPSHHWSFYIKPFTLDPTGMLQKTSKGQPRASCSPNLEESHLSVTGLAAEISHIVAHSSVSLLPGVCFSRVVMVHPACLSHTTIQRGLPLVGVMGKSQFWWRIHEHPVHWFFMRYKGTPFSNLAFHFIWFLLPLVLHFLLPLIGISFSQDKVTCFQQNGISLSFIVLLLSLSLRCGLHLCFLEGYSQSFM